MAGEMTGPEIVTDILASNKELIIALLIIMVAIFLIKWWQYINNRLERIK